MSLSDVTVRFPYPPGDYEPSSVVPDVDGGRRIVAGDPRVQGWLRSRGIDWNDVYRLRTLGGFVVVYRYANDAEGRKYLKRGNRVATRLPRLVLQ